MPPESPASAPGPHPAPPALRAEALLLLSLTALLAAPAAAGAPRPSVTKPVSFAMLEDYDKGHDLENIARDFQLMRELGVDVMPCSLGWDDYEPSASTTSPG